MIHSHFGTFLAAMSTNLCGAHNVRLCIKKVQSIWKQVNQKMCILWRLRLPRNRSRRGKKIDEIFYGRRTSPEKRRELRKKFLCWPSVVSRWFYNTFVSCVMFGVKLCETSISLQHKKKYPSNKKDELRRNNTQIGHWSEWPTRWKLLLFCAENLFLLFFN